MAIQTIVLIIITAVVVVNMALAEVSHRSNEGIKKALNLSCRVLDDCISVEEDSVENISEGYELNSDLAVGIDLEKLDVELKEVVGKNLRRFRRKNEKINRGNIIKARILVSGEYILVSRNECAWVPMLLRDGDKILSVYDNKNYKNIEGVKIPAGEYDIEKNIVEKVNEVIKGEMYDASSDMSYAVKIASGDIRVEEGRYNSLKGVTLFLLYIEESPKRIDPEFRRNCNFAITGYSVNTIKQSE